MELLTVAIVMGTSITVVASAENVVFATSSDSWNVETIVESVKILGSVGETGKT